MTSITEVLTEVLRNIVPTPQEIALIDKITENLKELIDEIVLVDDVEITKAMFLLMERMKFVVEPAGAAS